MRYKQFQVSDEMGLHWIKSILHPTKFNQMMNKKTSSRSDGQGYTRISWIEVNL